MLRSGNTTRFVILGLLSIEPMSGYGIHKEIKESLGFFWQESEGQIYPTLKKLEGAGHVSRLPSENNSARNRQLYVITPSGRDLLREWISQPPHDQPPRNEFQLKILLMRYGPPGAVLTHIRQHKQKISDRLERAARLKESLMEDTGYPDFPVWMALFRFGELVRQAEIAWCEETITALASVKPMKMKKPVKKKEASS